MEEKIRPIKQKTPPLVAGFFAKNGFYSLAMVLPIKPPSLLQNIPELRSSMLLHAKERSLLASATSGLLTGAAARVWAPSWQNIAEPFSCITLQAYDCSAKLLVANIAQAIKQV